jgi:hypothetical protein
MNPALDLDIACVTAAATRIPGTAARSVGQRSRRPFVPRKAHGPTVARDHEENFMRVGWIIYGAIAGVNGAACMSVLRLAARQAGLIDKMPPQVVQEWLARRAGVEPPGGKVGHHVADHVVHLAISGTAGALYGALASRTGRASYASGVLYGIAVWAVGFAGLIPLLGIARSAAAAETRENVLNISAHAVYGAVLALMTQEMQRQHRRRTWRGERFAARVG